MTDMDMTPFFVFNKSFLLNLLLKTRECTFFITPLLFYVSVSPTNTVLYSSAHTQSLPQVITKRQCLNTIEKGVLSISVIYPSYMEPTLFLLIKVFIESFTFL